MPSEGASYYGRMQQVTADLDAIRLEVTQAENRRDSLLQQIQGEKPTTNSPASDPWSQPGTTGVSLPIDARIQSLEQKLDELLLKYTEKHPDVMILRQTIADFKKQREQELAQYNASMANSGAENSSSQKKLERQPDLSATQDGAISGRSQSGFVEGQSG
jgi:uncharacterized protein involved in exopolysaccharide biosynthesis